MFRRKWVGLPSTLTLKGWEGIGTESSLATAAEAGDRLSHEDPESRVRSMRRPGRFEDGPGRRRAHSDGTVVSALEDEENLGDRLAYLDGEDETYG